MELSDPINRKRFSMLQYELGGTWTEGSSRHTGEPWSQRDAGKYLEGLGYELYMIGSCGWLNVPSEVFEGRVVGGNVMAMHGAWAPKDLRDLVRGRGCGG